MAPCVSSRKMMARSRSRLSITIEDNEHDLPPVHSGEQLREEFMKPLSLTAYRLAKEIGVPVMRVQAIIAERRGITCDTALRLARYFGTTPELVEYATRLRVGNSGRGPGFSSRYRDQASCRVRRPRSCAGNLVSSASIGASGLPRRCCGDGRKRARMVRLLVYGYRRSITDHLR
jgi:addiction module HigA family antidote